MGSFIFEMCSFCIVLYNLNGHGAQKYWETQLKYLKANTILRRRKGLGPVQWWIRCLFIQARKDFQELSRGDGIGRDSTARNNPSLSEFEQKHTPKFSPLRASFAIYPKTPEKRFAKYLSRYYISMLTNSLLQALGKHETGSLWAEELSLQPEKVANYRWGRLTDSRRALPIPGSSLTISVPWQGTSVPLLLIADAVTEVFFAYPSLSRSCLNRCLPIPWARCCLQASKICPHKHIPEETCACLLAAIHQSVFLDFKIPSML